MAVAGSTKLVDAGILGTIREQEDVYHYGDCACIEAERDVGSKTAEEVAGDIAATMTRSLAMVIRSRLLTE